jgi:hypothetical protein
LRELVMSAMTAASDRCCWLGGKGRVSGPAADDADGAQKLDPVGSMSAPVAALQISAEMA